MAGNKKYFVRRGKRGVIYLQERYLGVSLKDCLGTTDERIAALRRREIHIAVERGEYTNFKLFFEDAVKVTIEALVAGKAPRTRGSYEDALRLHLVPWFGKARMSDIETADLVEYKRAREAKGAGETAVRNEIWLARWVLKRYGRDVKGPDEPYIKPHKPVDRFPVEAEVLAIAGEIKRVEYRSLVLVAAYSGLRKSDVLALKWSAVDFKGEFIRIRQEKTDRWVKVPLHEKLIDALNMVPRGLGDTLVFPACKKGTLSDAWIAARKRAGLEWVRVHDLRHFFASYLASHGERREVIAEILGHKSIVSTARYAKFDDDTLKSAVDCFVRKPSAIPDAKGIK